MIEDRTVWLGQRRGGIGGSEVAALFGASPWASPYSLYLEKIGEGAPDEDTVYLEMGRELEPMTIRRYEAATGRAVEPNKQSLEHAEHPLLRCTPDGFITLCDGRDERGIYEGKIVGIHNKTEWDDGQIPIHVQIQAQHNMLVTGLRWASIAALVPGAKEPLIWRDVERDDKFCEKIVEVCQVFWHDHVLAREPPPTDAHSATTAALKRLHPHDAGTMIQLDHGFGAAANELDELKARRKELDAQIRGHENAIKAVLGANTWGRLPSGSGYSYRAQTRAAHFVNESTFRVLRTVSEKGMSKAQELADEALEDLKRGK